jgi:hypothetical protein
MVGSTIYMQRQQSKIGFVDLLSKLSISTAFSGEGVRNVRMN